MSKIIKIYILNVYNLGVYKLYLNKAKKNKVAMNIHIPKKWKVTDLRREREGAKERENGMVGDLHPT